MPCEMHDQEFPWISNKVKTMIYEKNIKFTGKNDLLATKIERCKILYIIHWRGAKASTTKTSQKIML